jgi:hypothetical protein
MLHLGPIEGLRTDRPEQWHITLRFLGEVDKSLVSAITDSYRGRNVLRRGRIHSRCDKSNEDFLAIVDRPTTGENPADWLETRKTENQARGLERTPGAETAILVGMSVLPSLHNRSGSRPWTRPSINTRSGILKNANYNELAVEGWMSGKLFQAAVAAAHVRVGAAPTAAEVLKGLDSLHGETLDVLAPPLTFTTGKPHPVGCWCYAVLKDDKFATPYCLKDYCTAK